jgi:hypothetical protein
MKYSITSVLITVLMISFSACKKDKHNNPPAPVTTPILSVKLNQQYLAPGQVDSAFAIWKINGQQQRIKMAIRHDSLISEMKVFNEGNGELSLHIFSNKKYSNQHYGQWLSKKTLSLQKTKAISYNGPSSFYDVAWFPRVELADGIAHKAIVALRPDDAFFLVKHPGHAITKLVVERSYWKTIGGIQLAGTGIWECTGGCTDVANDEYFRFLPGAIGTKPWNHLSIIVLFETTHNGEGWGLSLEHDL